ncbi:unnamed protein product [Closterium sp. NIES-64]|nr:unnamed protein product [Closterium sp. NIES-64]
MKGLKGHGSKKRKAKESSGGEQHLGGKRGNKGGKQYGGKCCSLEVKEVSHDMGGAEGEAAEVEGVLQQEVEGVLQQEEALVAEKGDAEEEVQQPTPSPTLPPRRTTQGKSGAVRGGIKEGAAKERPKRAAHPRDFLKYERFGASKELMVQEEEDDE